MIAYQVHIGTYAVRTAGVNSTFLDVIGKIPYLVSLGVNVLQPLPVDEVEENPSMGYNGADLFSPDFSPTESPIQSHSQVILQPSVAFLAQRAFPRSACRMSLPDTIN
jgi:hypothetical protein